MKITIEVIPHRLQRYNTAGDWTIDVEGNIAIRVSDMGDWRYNAAVAVHELVEALLCRRAGVSQAEVDRFDDGFQGEGEPGDDHDAPYAQQHCFATAVERMLIAALEVPWDEYEKAVEGLK